MRVEIIDKHTRQILDFQNFADASMKLSNLLSPFPSQSVFYFDKEGKLLDSLNSEVVKVYALSSLDIGILKELSKSVEAKIKVRLGDGNGVFYRKYFVSSDGDLLKEHEYTFDRNSFIDYFENGIVSTINSARNNNSVVGRGGLIPVSGDSDSTALALSVHRTGIYSDITIVAIRDETRQKQNEIVQELARKIGSSVVFLTRKDFEERLGIKDFLEFVRLIENGNGGNESILRRTLIDYLIKSFSFRMAEENGIGNILYGSIVQDVAQRGLISVMTGNVIQGTPVRQIGSVTEIEPMYLTYAAETRLYLEALDPHLSIMENYREYNIRARDDLLIYRMLDSMEEVWPGICQYISFGVSKLALHANLSYARCQSCGYYFISEEDGICQMCKLMEPYRGSRETTRQ